MLICITVDQLGHSFTRAAQFTPAPGRLLPTVGLFLIAFVLSGCSPKGPPSPPPPSPEQMAASQKRRGAAKLSIEEIGKQSFGSRLNEVRQLGDTVYFTFTPKLDGEPEQNFNRMLAMGAGAAPMTFGQNSSAASIHITAIHETDPNRKLIVYSISREASGNVDWSHGGTVEKVAAIAKFEHVDPEVKEFLTAP